MTKMETQEAARPVTSYAGSYHYLRMGKLRVEVTEGRLFEQLGIQRAELIPAGGDEFSIDWEGSGEPVKVRFAFDAVGPAIRFEWDDRIFDLVETSSPK